MVPGRPSSDWNMARVHGVVELAASMTTTWAMSPLRICRMRVAGAAGGRLPRGTVRPPPPPAGG